MHLLVIDIGNTTISSTLFEDNTNIASFRVPSGFPWYQDLLTTEFQRFLRAHLPSMEALDGAVMTSVVPSCTVLVQEAIRSLTGRETLIVTAALPCGIDLSRYDAPHLGTDRIVDMAAAASLYPGEPVAVWDLGTATTLSVVNSDRVLVGGMISPGVALGLRALHEHTAQLPDVQPGPVSSVLGLDTASNMLSGSVAATGFMITTAADYIERVYELPGLHVILTGGLAAHVLPFITRENVRHVPDLQHRGLLAIWSLHHN